MKKSKTYKVFSYIILSILTVIFVYPFFNMIMLSFMSYNELQQFPPQWLPETFQFENYKNILGAFGYTPEGTSYVWTFLSNTLFVMVLKTVGLVLSCTLCAYGFAKINFPGKNIIFFAVLATVMIPNSVTMIPLFTLFKNFGWLDTLTPLWFPVWFGGGAMNIFMLRQYMRTIPNTILESAYLDGAGHLRTYWHIIMPNIKPMIFMLLLGSIDGAWGDYFQPMIYINSKDTWTIALAVRNMVSSTDAAGGVGAGALNVQMATCVVMSLVPLITFAAGQKNFVENVTITGVKG